MEISMSIWHLTYRTRAAAAKAWRLINLPSAEKTWESTYCVRLRSSTRPFSEEFVLQEALMIEDLMVVCYSYDGLLWMKVEMTIGLTPPQQEVPLSGDLILLLASFLSSEVDLEAWSRVSTLHRHSLGPRPLHLVSLVDHHLGRRYNLKVIVASLRNFPFVVQHCMLKGLGWKDSLASASSLLQLEKREKNAPPLNFTLKNLLATLRAAPTALHLLLEGKLSRRQGEAILESMGELSKTLMLRGLKTRLAPRDLGTDSAANAQHYFDWLVRNNHKLLFSRQANPDVVENFSSLHPAGVADLVHSKWICVENPYGELVKLNSYHVNEFWELANEDEYHDLDKEQKKEQLKAAEHLVNVSRNPQLFTQEAAVLMLNYWIEDCHYFRLWERLCIGLAASMLEYRYNLEGIKVVQILAPKYNHQQSLLAFLRLIDNEAVVAARATLIGQYALPELDAPTYRFPSLEPFMSLEQLSVAFRKLEADETKLEISLEGSEIVLRDWSDQLNLGGYYDHLLECEGRLEEEEPSTSWRIAKVCYEYSDCLSCEDLGDLRRASTYQSFWSHVSVLDRTHEDGYGNHDLLSFTLPYTLRRWFILQTSNGLRRLSKTGRKILMLGSTRSVTSSSTRTETLSRSLEQSKPTIPNTVSV